MSQPPEVRRRWLSWLLFGFSLTCFLAVPILRAVGGLELALNDLFVSASGVSFAAVGMLITRRQPANRIGLLSLFSGASIALLTFLTTYGQTSLNLDRGLPAVELAWLAASLIGPLVVAGPFLLLPLLFPDGRPLSKRWWRLAWVPIALGQLIGVLQLLDPAKDQVTGSYGTLLALSPEQTALITLIQDVRSVLFSLWVFSILLGVISLMIRWRRSRGLVRRQLSIFVSLTVLVIILLIAMEQFGALISPAFFDTVAYESAVSLVWLALPVILGVTVLRYRLYDVEVIINRSLVYGALSASLAAVYFGSVVVLQALFRAVSGGESPLVIVLSTLMIAVLFAPLRQRIQAFIDRRFYRRKYDARRTLERFAATARDEVDLERLTAALLQTVDETMQPEHVGLWLRSETADRSRRKVWS